MQFDPTIRQSRNHRIVGYHDDRAPLLVKFAQQAKYDFFVLGIEIAGGLVSEHNLRIIDERPRDANPLLFATRHLRWQMMCTFFQTHAFKSLKRFLLVRHAMKILREHHIFESGEEGNQVKLLEHKTYLFRTHAIQLSRRKVGDVLAIQPDFAGCGTIQRTIKFTIVLLPDPDGPIIATHSPAATDSETLSSARIWPPFFRLLWPDRP